ncbi:MAG: serine protein kinase PrkA, partial [Halalkalicoccus sp.]
MTGDNTLEALSQQYRETVPSDLRDAKTFAWYLETVRSDPKVARNAHQRVADMFDHYGTRYDEESGTVEYLMASEDPLGDGENTFYGEVVH